MYDKEYSVENLYVGIIARQNKGLESFNKIIKLFNIKVGVFLKEGNLYRHLLSDGIYSASPNNSNAKIVINADTLQPLIDAEPKLARLEKIRRSHIAELEDILQTTYFDKFEKETSIDTLSYKAKEK